MTRRGRCAVCNRSVRLRNNGRVGSHGPDFYLEGTGVLKLECSGVGSFPLPPRTRCGTTTDAERPSPQSACALPGSPGGGTDG